MEILLQQNLPHQQKAVDAICAALEGVQISAPKLYFENPRISLTDPRLPVNIHRIQAPLPLSYQSNAPIGNCLNLDIKMETGTGKTYVYTKTIFELNRRFGMNKFIIVTPSLAIKAGTAQFLQDEYVRRHFSDGCGYGTELEVNVLEPPKNKKKGRAYFPGAVSNFVKGSCQNTRKIHVLLFNMQLLTSAKLLTRDDYGYGIEGFYRPLDALRATCPIVIIDEPHRFSREQKAFKAIMEEIRPQCLIRFGATFPEITNGRGKNKVTVKDYQNLLYDLNACESFNQGLIKGVAKEHFEPVSKREEKIKIMSIASKDSVTLQYKKRDEATKLYKLKTGDSLSMISKALEGISVYAIASSTVEFSNGVVKTTGEELDVDIYMTSYQEQMLRLALERHFETERENFCNRMFKIKTLALFFIDDITSYRVDENGKLPYLRMKFEQLLKERIELVLASLNEHETEYRAYLEASLADLSACHAGYFSQDNSDSDENIAKEVDIILHGKKKLLSFRNEDGSYYTLRFLFSKWTLKEGWDNPNVFTIAKLRSSGSENSKLQEVGRGLRLPVDENGNRVSNEEFQLNYIVDFTEADFAKRLVEQINGEVPLASAISEERLIQVAAQMGLTSDELFDLLYDKHYIDRHMNIKPESRDLFFAEYPGFAAGISAGKVRDRNQNKPKPIRIRKGVYEEIRPLWERLNQRYLLYYAPDINEELESVVLSLFENSKIFTDVVMSSTRDIVTNDGDQMAVTRGTGVQYTIMRPIAYNVFLKRIMRITNLPITILHQALCAYAKKHGNVDARYFNENSVSAFCAAFQAWKTRALLSRIRYVKSSAITKATALTYSDGTPRPEISQGRIGTKLMPGTPSEKYLYDSYTYDSPLEQNNLTADIEEVVVYGKIPRGSIAIPTTTGEMYSPDFMYVVKKASSEMVVNLVVETKDVENKGELQGTEAAKIECARLFFETLAQDGYTISFEEQINNKQIKQIIQEVLEQKRNPPER